MKIFISVLMVCVCLFSLNAYTETVPTATVSDVFTFKGQIVHVFHADEYYGIVGEDGTEYRPVHIPEGYKVENLHVEVTARLRDKKLLSHGWGTAIEIISIKRI